MKLFIIFLISLAAFAQQPPAPQQPKLVPHPVKYTTAQELSLERLVRAKLLADQQMATVMEEVRNLQQYKDQQAAVKELSDYLAKLTAELKIDGACQLVLRTMEFMCPPVTAKKDSP